MLPYLRSMLPPPEAWLPFLAASYSERRFTNGGPNVRRLERALTEKYGSADRQAVLVVNCTSGLTAALLALGVRDPVVVPAFTFPATAMAVLQAGCQPVFCDVSWRTWELDPASLAAILRTRKIGAVLHVRSFGLCRDLRPILERTRSFDVPLIVDAAAALGGCLHDGSWAGSQGDMEVFSLHATKVFGIGEGGVVFCHPRHVTALKETINFGLADGDVVRVGMNGKMNEFQAAIGLAVLQELDQVIQHRRAVAEAYQAALTSRCDAASAKEIGRPVWQTFPLLLPPGREGRTVAEYGKEAGVEVRRYYCPVLPESALFRPGTRQIFPVASQLSRRMICLPVYSDMTDDEVHRVIAVVKRALDSRPVAVKAA